MVVSHNIIFKIRSMNNDKYQDLKCHKKYLHTFALTVILDALVGGEEEVHWEWLDGI